MSTSKKKSNFIQVYIRIHYFFFCFATAFGRLVSSGFGIFLSEQIIHTQQVAPMSGPTMPWLWHFCGPRHLGLKAGFGCAWPRRAAARARSIMGARYTTRALL